MRRGHLRECWCHSIGHVIVMSNSYTYYGYTYCGYTYY